MSAARLAAARLLYTKYTSHYDIAGVPSLPTEKVIENMQNHQEMLLIDCRTHQECEVSMIPTAIKKKEFEALAFHENNAIKKDYKDKLIVPYCTIGARSGRYTRNLRQKGFTNVYNGDGIVIWTHFNDVNDPRNFGLVNAKGEKVHKVHTFLQSFDLLPESYEGVYFSTWEFIWVMIDYLAGRSA